MHSFLLQAQGGTDITGMIMMFVLVGGVFYFFMIRPQSKKAKAQKNFRESLKKGDKVVTIGGIHGRIKDQNDSTIMLETDGGAKMRIEKSAISMEMSSGDGGDASAEIEQNK
ncbi:preprotein translocase subunit YajC [bacterium SCSIO 12741]|nr:preprotein translocase subunit YajC [bacterium SCSIO 12741]